MPSVDGATPGNVARWRRPILVAGSTVTSSVLLPLLINKATESQPAMWVYPTVAAVTFVIALQAVRGDPQRDRAPAGADEVTVPPPLDPSDDRPYAAATTSVAPQVEHQVEGRAGGPHAIGRTGVWPDASLIDHGSAQAARVYDYLLGGDDNFDVDRQLAQRIYASAGGIEKARLRVRANRDFLGRAVRYLAGEVGVRQFLDLGTGIPNADNTHGIAQAIAPESRIVYVDHDAVVLAHAHTLTRDSHPGATRFVYGDLRDHEMVLQAAAETLDFSQPMAVVMVGVLHHLRDEEHPEAIIRRYLDALAPQSYLVLENIGAESEDVAKLGDIIDRCPDAHFTLVPRTRADMLRFFDGTELVEPGVVYVDRWRPDGPLPAYETRHPCGVGRKR